jgi:hypothetical protein
MLMRNILTLQIEPRQGKAFPIEVEVRRIGCSRNAARDIDGTKAGIAETRAQGYSMHAHAGICFRSRYLLTSEAAIEVQGAQTSGEVEFVAIRHAGDIYLSVGSDHNDRSLCEMTTTMLGKVYDTAKMKQLAPAAVASKAWLYEEVKDHWDDIVLRSYVTVEGDRIMLQEFPLSNLLDLSYYLDDCPWFAEEGSVLFGGSSSLAAGVPDHVYQGQDSMDGVYFAPDFHCEMMDPVLSRTLTHSYNILALEEPGSLGL